MASRIGEKEWKWHYAVAGIVDLVQICIDFFPPVGPVINAVLDVLIGIFLIVYFFLRGFNAIFHPKILFSLLGVVVLEEFTGGIAPAWILDMWYIHRTIAQEQGMAEPEIPKGITLPRGNRAPPIHSTPGLRPPRLPPRLPTPIQ